MEEGRKKEVNNKERHRQGFRYEGYAKGKREEIVDGKGETEEEEDKHEKDKDQDVNRKG